MSGASLSLRQREVLICRCAEDLSQADTAIRLGIARQTVGELQRRAFRKIGARCIAGACFRFGLRAAHLKEMA